jgi:putative membrane protein
MTSDVSWPPAQDAMMPSEPPQPGPPVPVAAILDAPGVIASRRLHPLSPLLGMLVALRQVAAGLVLVAINQLWWVLPALALVPAWAFVRWWRTTFDIGEHGITMHGGVLWRQTKSAPPERLQQIDVVRKLRHQALGVSMVTIEFAGDQIALECLSTADAERVKVTLEALRRRQSAVAAGEASATPAGQVMPPPPPPQTELLTLPPRLLMIGGVTGAGLVTVPLAGLALFEQLDELPGLRDLGDSAVESASGVGVGAVGAVIGVVVTAAAVLAIAAGVFVLRYHGYALARRGNDIVVRHGLLDRRSSVIPITRVQAVALHQSVLRRRLGLAALNASTAAVISRKGVGTAGQLLPIARLDDAVDLERTLLGAAPPPLHPHPPAAQRRAIVRRCLLLLPPTVVAWLLQPLAGLLVTPLAGLAAVAWGRWWYRRLASGRDDRLITAAAGAMLWQRRSALLGKAQAMRTSASPLQRRAGLVTVFVDIAGGSPVRIPDLAVNSPVLAALRSRLAGEAVDDAVDDALQLGHVGLTDRGE